MRVFESSIKVRRIASRNFNHYTIHQNVESIVAGNATSGDLIRVPYVFDYIVDKPNKMAFVCIRTIQPTNLPGEKSLEYHFDKGQQVKLGLHILPTKRSKIKNDHIFIEDKLERESKVLSRLEESGLDVELLDEVEILSRYFEKGEHKFSQHSARYYVEAKISDVSSFESVFAYGLGRRANFGYGKITILE
ncbi:hypothetical protein AB3A98_002960 [Vibrio parahaemolyticus]